MTIDADVPAQSPDGHGAKATAVRRLAVLLHKGALSTGDVAALRRMDPWHPPLAYFKLEALAFPSMSDTDIGPVGVSTRWAAIATGLAILGDLQRDGREDRSYALGRVLGGCGYTELRFSRLLQADAPRLIDDLPMLARYLVGKRLHTDWLGAARLLLSAGTRREESVRRQLARDYFAAASEHTR